MDDHERELRRLRLEAREQRHDVEAAEAELAASGTRLAEVLLDWAAQGRQLRVDTTDRPRRGHVVHVGDSVVTLMAGDGRREVLALRHVEGFGVTGATDKRGPDCSLGHPASLVAHLRSLVGERQAVIVERCTTDPIQGTVIGVADTHVVLRSISGTDAMIPLDAIVSVSIAG